MQNKRHHDCEFIIWKIVSGPKWLFSLSPCENSDGSQYSPVGIRWYICFVASLWRKNKQTNKQKLNNDFVWQNVPTLYCPDIS